MASQALQGFNYRSWASKETPMGCMNYGSVVNSMGSVVYCGSMVNGMG